MNLEPSEPRSAAGGGGLRVATATPATRRLLLFGVGAVAAAAALPAWSRDGLADPFTLGVACGDPAPDGFVIWTRLAPEPLAPDGLGGLRVAAPVQWEVAEDEGFRRVVARGVARADPAWAHSVHVEVAGLRSGRDHWYRFHALGARSPVGRGRTTPAAGAPLDRLRLAFVSCSHWEEGWFTAYRRIAEERPDLVLFLGDYIYEYNNKPEKRAGRPRLHPVPEAVDLPTYRLRHALYKTDADLQALHAAAPCLMTWDDHEVENDYGGLLSPHREVTVAAERARRTAAYRAYYEHMPLRRRSLPRGADMRVYDRFRFGDLVEMPVLDGRQYRDPQACPTKTWAGGHVVPPTCLERDAEARSMLGRAQEAWLFEGFRRSTARWNLMAQDLLVAELLQEDKKGVVGHWTDGWDGYPACRRRVLEAVRDSRSRNPVFLGGDIHSFWTTDLKVGGREGPTVATEFVGGSVTADAPDYALFAKRLPENPQIRYFESRKHGYVAAEVTRSRMDVRFMAVDRLSKDAPAGVLARFSVEDGRPGAQAA